MPTEKKRFGISPLFLVAASVLVYLEGPAVAAVIFLSAAVHELGHFGAAALFGGKPTGFFILPIGMKIELDAAKMSYLGEAVTALAGPFVNVIMWAASAVVARYTGLDIFVFSAAANFFLAVLNMIPALPLDGGRALRCVLRKHLEDVEKADGISDVVTLVSLVAVFAFGIYVLVSSGYNISLIAISLFLLVTLLREKLAAKEKIPLLS
ncbi:MAG: hypothetical protein II808_02145 [Clostridia bacterium]|nr:hypothetical protein [Clostridia bacterium]